MTARNVAYRPLQSAKAEMGEQTRSTNTADTPSVLGKLEPETASQ